MKQNQNDRLEEIVPEGHPYPFMIALEAQRLIQGALFFAVAEDTAAGEWFRSVPESETELRKILLSYGYSDITYETSWNCFVHYVDLYEKPMYQQLVISFISYWDWYITKIGKFVKFAEENLSAGKIIDKNLLFLHKKPFVSQIELLEKTSSLKLNIENNILEDVIEMHLVRHLGTHNLWIMDEEYCNKSKNKFQNIGEIRVIQVDELVKWQKSYLAIMNTITFQVAAKYKDIDYQYDKDDKFLAKMQIIR